MGDDITRVHSGKRANSVVVRRSRDVRKRSLFLGSLLIGGKMKESPKILSTLHGLKSFTLVALPAMTCCLRLDAAPFAGTTIPRIVVICVNCGYQSEMFISGAVGLDERRPLAFTFTKMNRMVPFKLFLRLFCCRLTNSMKSNQMIM